MDKRILLVGTVSNVGKTIEKELRVVCKALSVFDFVKIYLVESDSTDNTVEILEKIKLAKTNFDFTSLGTLKEKIPHRIERIAHCRNYYVEYFRTKHQTSNFDYVAVADLDGMNFRINKRGIKSCFDSNIQWSGMMANQKFGYYDIYALRAPGWVESDCFNDLRKAKEFSVPPRLSKWLFLNFLIQFKYYDSFRKTYIYDQMKRIKVKNDLIKVDSAFGGFAIYKPEVFLQSLYGNSRSFESEHVDFHKTVEKSEKAFYINPKLINSGFNVYNSNKLLIVRFLRELKKFNKI
jgi:glycosyltransferase involved in cell wall biosynthesis